MRKSGLVWTACGIAALAFGSSCGGGGHGQGPGASNVLGNIAVALTSGDASVDGIQAIARGDGQEVDDLTDSGGAFQLIDAPTGEIVVVFRRSGCEGSLPLGAVVSNSTIDLTNVSFVCPPDDPFDANVGIESIVESFRAVAHEDGTDSGASLRLCVRVGSDNRVRTIEVPVSADVRDEGNRSISRGAIDHRDLLQIDGTRSTTGGTFIFDANSVAIVDTNAEDACDLP